VGDLKVEKKEEKKQNDTKPENTTAAETN